MVVTLDNNKIGKYLDFLILSKYDTKRSFYKEYVKIKYNVNEDCVSFEDNLKSETNRFNQIIHGKKGIQTHDLPIVSYILGVTYEEILSAGESLKNNNSNIDSENNSVCEECGYVFKENWIKFCPICGTMGKSYKEKNFKDYKKLTRDELRNLRYEIRDFQEKIYTYVYELEEKAKSNNYKYNDLVAAYLYDLPYVDINKVLYWANKGASLGDTLCNDVLADLYYEGVYVEKDINKAYRYLEDALENIDCYYKLAHWYCFEKGEFRNLDKGIKMLKTLSEIEYGEKYYDALKDLGILYYEEFQDYEKAFEYFSKIKVTVYEEDVNFYMGEFYYLGRVVEQNYEKAVFYYKKGSYPSFDSKLRLAECYLEGKGVTKDKIKTLEIYDELIDEYTKEKDFNKVIHLNTLKKIVMEEDK